LKFPERWNWAEVRHRFVLTPEEKRVLLFVLAALLLGIGTQCYRDTHPLQPLGSDKKHAQKTQR